jgi:3-methyl-2-oxobutanoate hydroxymethyltransferase
MPHLTIPRLQKKKQKGEKISMVTCYDATFASLVEEAEIDMALVGDSLGMVIQGHESTLPVTVDDIVYHCRAVARGLNDTHLIADMPFMSYQGPKREAMKNAGRMIKEGRAESIKLEGGEEIADLVKALDKVGIPVMAHIGLKPQQVNKMGGYKIQGMNLSEEEIILREAQILEDAGAYAILMEGVSLETAKKVTAQAKVPTIGISSGPHCDGQVLVLYDLLGLNPDFKPRFVKHYANLNRNILDALKQYKTEVEKKKFPTAAHAFQQNVFDITKNIKNKKKP